jgi:hypothetical protein
MSVLSHIRSAADPDLLLGLWILFRLRSILRRFISASGFSDTYLLGGRSCCYVFYLWLGLWLRDVYVLQWLYGCRRLLRLFWWRWVWLGLSLVHIRCGGRKLRHIFANRGFWIDRAVRDYVPCKGLAGHRRFVRERPIT